jgi:uncharacterized integral membrane protein
MLDVIDRGAFTIIFTFMVCIPLGTRFISSGRLKAAWILITSNLAFILVMIFYLQETKMLTFIIPELNSNYLVFGLFLGHITVATISVLVWEPRSVETGLR